MTLLGSLRKRWLAAVGMAVAATARCRLREPARRAGGDAGRADEHRHADDLRLGPGGVEADGESGRTGCPAGTGTIQIADVKPPARLLIDSESVTPEPVTRSTSSISLRFRVTACGGRPVQGAAAYGTPVPYNQFTAGSGTTGADGFATMTLSRMTGFPADRRQQLLTIFTRAGKPGEPIVAGVSTRLLTAFHVRLG